MAFAFRHSPLLRRSADQHDPAAGADVPQLLPRRRDAGTAAGHLHRECGVVIHRGHRRGLDTDAAPVGFQFLRDQHRQRGVDALPHLRLVDDDGDAVVRRDADESVGRVDGFRRRIGRISAAAFHRQVEADHQPAGQCGGILDEFAARGILRGHVFHLVFHLGFHLAPPPCSANNGCFATFSIAARMRL